MALPCSSVCAVARIYSNDQLLRPMESRDVRVPADRPEFHRSCLSSSRIPLIGVQEASRWTDRKVGNRQWKELPGRRGGGSCARNMQRQRLPNSERERLTASPGTPLGHPAADDEKLAGTRRSTSVSLAVGSSSSQQTPILSLDLSSVAPSIGLSPRTQSPSTCHGLAPCSVTSLRLCLSATGAESLQAVAPMPVISHRSHPLHQHADHALRFST